MTSLIVESAGPGVTLQDYGRPGYLASGLSRGGAADRMALIEAGALLNGGPGITIEMAGYGGKFRVSGGPVTIALSGAPMRATCAGRALDWVTTHQIADGAVIEIGSAISGTYGYLTIAGEIDQPKVMGSISTHSGAGIGERLDTGSQVQLKPAHATSGLTLPTSERFTGGELRVLKGPQTNLFDEETIARFQTTKFARAVRGNRMGIELEGGAKFSAKGGLSTLSEMIVPGDIQMTGDGAPFILGPECQTTGGYPRIGTVIPSDLDRAMQASPGTALTFRFVDRSEALTALRADKVVQENLRPMPKVRDPHDIADLLSYQLVDGAISGREP